MDSTVGIAIGRLRGTVFAARHQRIALAGASAPQLTEIPGIRGAGR